MLSERDKPTEGYLFLSNKGQRLTTRFINEAMKTLAERTFGEEKAKEFQTKALRGFYNSALLRANIQPQELKDVMMGHGRKGARSHYPYDEFTIREAYSLAFEHLTINGTQVREDIQKFREQTNKIIAEQQRQITALRDFMKPDNLRKVFEEILDEYAKEQKKKQQ